MNFLQELKWRGLLQDVSDEQGLERLDRSCSFYVGYDPTAPSLQLGNLIPMIVSIHLARAGFRAIQLFGGATGAIGDPSGRSSERPLLTRSEIEAYVANHRRCVEKIFERAGVQALAVDNYDWTASLGVIEFLREVGKHFTVNYMLSKEVVHSRLDNEGISFTEFSYMLLQAHDFLQLYGKHKCRLQIGGSDQWGNMTAGLELLRKKGLADAYALSIPLLLDSQGRKFGKSAGATIWLDAAHTSPYRFHQFWLNTPDADVIRYLKVFTFLSADEIEAIEVQLESKPEERLAQTVLADNVCSLVHGDDATSDAKRSAEVLFGGSIDGLSDQKLLDIFQDVPSSELPRQSALGLSAVELLVQTKLCASKGEARRLISAGGAYLNNRRLTDPESMTSEHLLESSSLLILRSGKKNYKLVKLID